MTQIYVLKCMYVPIHKILYIYIYIYLRSCTSEAVSYTLTLLSLTLFQEARHVILDKHNTSVFGFLIFF